MFHLFYRAHKDNLDNIINNGYSLNEYSKQSLNNLITKKNIKKNLFEKSVNIFNNLAKNSIDIGNEALNTIMKRIQQKNRYGTTCRNMGMFYS